MKHRMRGEEQLVTRSMIRRMRIPEIHWSASLGSIDPAFSGAYVEAITRYITRIREMVLKGVGLLLHGPHGSGKTALAALVLLGVRALKGDGLFLEAGEVTQTAFGSMFDDETTMLEQARQVEMLVIDDYGADHWSEFGARTIENLVRHRVANLKPLIVTTNLQMPSFAHRVGKGVMELLKAHTVPMLVEGLQWRKERQTELHSLAGELGLV